MIHLTREFFDDSHLFPKRSFAPLLCAIMKAVVFNLMFQYFCECLLCGKGELRIEDGVGGNVTKRLARLIVGQQHTLAVPSNPHMSMKRTTTVIVVCDTMDEIFSRVHYSKLMYTATSIEECLQRYRDLDCKKHIHPCENTTFAQQQIQKTLPSSLRLESLGLEALKRLAKGLNVRSTFDKKAKDAGKDFRQTIIDVLMEVRRKGVTTGQLRSSGGSVPAVALWTEHIKNSANRVWVFFGDVDSYSLPTVPSEVYQGLPLPSGGEVPDDVRRQHAGIYSTYKIQFQIQSHHILHFNRSCHGGN